jgi:hypothetical protein
MHANMGCAPYAAIFAMPMFANTLAATLDAVILFAPMWAISISALLASNFIMDACGGLLFVKTPSHSFNKWPCDVFLDIDWDMQIHKIIIEDPCRVYKTRFARTSHIPN